MGVQGNQEVKYEMEVFLGAFDMYCSQQKHLKEFYIICAI